MIPASAGLPALLIDRKSESDCFSSSSISSASVGSGRLRLLDEVMPAAALIDSYSSDALRDSAGSFSISSSSETRRFRELDIF
jgi:hypothetical protein